MSKRYTTEFINKCYKEYSKGVSISKIATENNVDRKALTKAIKRSYPDLDTSKKNYSSNSRSKYSFNSDYFSEINTEEKAYWLGFLYADGYLKKDKPVIDLALKSDDIGHIEKFLKCLESNHKIYHKKIKLKNKEYSASRVCFYNKDMHGDLVKLGCVNNKSKILQYPDFIEGNLERHFIRGFFDGDGSISPESRNHQKISRVRFFCGSEDFISILAERLKHYLDTDIDYVWDRTCFAIIYGRNKDKIKLLNYMYKDCNIYLDRKYDLYKRSVLPF